MKADLIHSTKFIREINQFNVNKNLITYNLFMKTIMNLDSYPEEKDLAMISYKHSKEIPTGALAAIFSDPSFSYWIYLSKCLTNRIKNNEFIPSSDLPYLKGVDHYDSSKSLKYHLNELNRFLVAASLLAKVDVEVPVNIINNGFYLPILGIYLKIENENRKLIASFKILNSDEAVFKIGDKIFNNFQEILYKAEEGVKTIYNFGDDILIQPSLKGSGGKIILDCIDPFFRLGWSSLYKNPDGTGYIPVDIGNINEYINSFHEAESLIDDNWEEMGYQLSSTIRTIHIVHSPLPDQHMSCTSEQYYGGILTSTGNKFLLAEAIVHEYSHNLLNMVISSGEIFPGSPPKEEIYYSPWRNDARPISGVFHAVFVFVNVFNLLKKLNNAFPNNEDLRTRILDVYVRLQMGIKVLKTYNFDKPLSLEILKNLETQASNFDIKFSKSEISKAKLNQLEHLSNWRLKYQDLSLPNDIYS